MEDFEVVDSNSEFRIPINKFVGTHICVHLKWKCTFNRRKYASLQFGIINWNLNYSTSNLGFVV
jgi:hypothetical protein